MTAKRARSLVLVVATLAGAAFGALVGYAASMWGGMEVILPVAAGLCAAAAYVTCRMTFSAMDAFRG